VEGAELEGGVIKLGGVEVGGEVSGGFLARAGLGEPGLLQEPILITTLSPLAEVARVEVFGVRAEALDDVGVGEAIEEPLIDLSADGLGEASDFSVTAMVERGWS
jgi:hypothetical protein